MGIYKRRSDGTYENAVVSNSQPENQDVFWIDSDNNALRVYSDGEYKIVSKFGVDSFDNNGGSYWDRYISIPINSDVSEDVQYMVEIVGDTINVYKNDLTGVLVSGNGGSNFWASVNGNGSDIRVSDELYGQLYFWVEEFDYSNQKCRIWTKLMAGMKEIRIWFGNQYASKSSYCGGNQVFEFFDDFSVWEGWIQYGTGSVAQDTTTFGFPTLKKYNGSAPNGGFKNIGITITSPVICETRFYRYDYSGGPVETLASVVDDSGNGYKFAGCAVDQNGTIGLERVDGFSSGVSLTSATSNYKAYVWNIGQLIWNNGSLIGHVFDDSYLLLNSISASDTTYNTFTTVYVNNGIVYYYDWIRIRKYLSSDLTFGTPIFKLY